MKIKLILIFIFSFIGLRGYSQVSNEFPGGSPYSIFGMGDLNYYTSARTYSMGILGTSLFGNYVNTYNPAALTKLRNTIITTNFNYGFLRSVNDISQNEVSDGNVLGINLGIPFDQVRGWAMSLGFNPATLVNYKIKLLESIGGEEYSQTYSGNGGLSRISIGMSYNVLRKISIGLEYDYAFGEIMRLNYINFNNSGYTNTLIRKETDFQNSFMKAGIIFEIGKLLNNLKIRNLSLGFAYQSGFDLSTRQDGIYTTATGIDTVFLKQGLTSFPASYSAGISNLFGNKYLVSADIAMQDWSNFTELSASATNYFTSYRAGIGMEIFPDPESVTFFGRMTYRLGGFYEKSYYQVKGQDITGFGIRGGVNVPISTYNSLDFGVNYSVKGTSDNGLIKDEFLNFTAAVNFGELWFIRPRDEDK
ncbi:MAG: hypothetical protein JNJ56_01855 [Ignavibacteria bacterium]|nr:hypothetical protein [Ignavibacteria bacterium]